MNHIDRDDPRSVLCALADLERSCAAARPLARGWAADPVSTARTLDGLDLEHIAVHLRAAERALALLHAAWTSSLARRYHRLMQVQADISVAYEVSDDPELRAQAYGDVSDAKVLEVEAELIDSDAGYLLSLDGDWQVRTRRVDDPAAGEVACLWLRAGANQFLLGIFADEDLASRYAAEHHDQITRDGGILQIEVTPVRASIDRPATVPEIRRVDVPRPRRT